MKLQLHVAKDGAWSTGFAAGDAETAELIETAGHKPSGYFWSGVAELSIRTMRHSDAASIQMAPNDDGFHASSFNRDAIERLARTLSQAATDNEAMRAILEQADTTGFEFADQ